MPSVLPWRIRSNGAGHDVEEPWLGVHRRRRALGDLDNVVNDVLGHRVGLIATNAAAFVNQGFEIHCDNLSE
jgi:hypothetical protein